MANEEIEETTGNGEFDWKSLGIAVEYIKHEEDLAASMKEKEELDKKLGRIDRYGDLTQEDIDTMEANSFGRLYSVAKQIESNSQGIANRGPLGNFMSKVRGLFNIKGAAEKAIESGAHQLHDMVGEISTSMELEPDSKTSKAYELYMKKIDATMEGTSTSAPGETIREAGRRRFNRLGESIPQSMAEDFDKALYDGLTDEQKDKLREMIYISLLEGDDRRELRGKVQDEMHGIKIDIAELPAQMAKCTNRLELNQALVTDFKETMPEAAKKMYESKDHSLLKGMYEDHIKAIEEKRKKLREGAEELRNSVNGPKKDDEGR